MLYAKHMIIGTQENNAGEGGGYVTKVLSTSNTDYSQTMFSQNTRGMSHEI